MPAEILALARRCEKTSLFALGSRSPAGRRADRFDLIAAGQGQPALFDCEEIRLRSRQRV
jgi:hypothetical protein